MTMVGSPVVTEDRDAASYTSPHDGFNSIFLGSEPFPKQRVSGYDEPWKHPWGEKRHIVIVSIALLVFLLLISGLAFAALFSRQRAKIIPKIASRALAVEDYGTRLDQDWQALRNSQTAANGLVLLQSNLDAFAARVMTARSAGRSLDLMYYMWNADLTGRLMMREVIAAADRGVRVRLLLDDLGVSMPDRVFHAIDCHPRIELRLFNPTKARENIVHRFFEMLVRFRSVNRRMHNKAWIADGRVSIVGGRNISDAYFDADELSNFRDFDVMSVGETVRDVEAIFDDYWNSAATVPIRALLSRRENRLARLRRSMDALYSSEEARPYLERVRSHDTADDFFTPDRLFWVDHVNVVADPPEKAAGKRRHGHNMLMETLLPILEAAQSSLRITSPYFIPGSKGVDTFSTLASNGVDVAILTNSLAATDVAAVHAGYARYRKPLLAGGVRLFELRAQAEQGKFSLRGSGRASLHTKAFTRDDHHGFVGSLNFDPRSVSLNTEMGILFMSHGLVAAMNDVFASEISPEMSYRIEADGKRRLAWVGTVNGTLQTRTREPDAGPGRRIISWLMSWLPLESQL